MKNHWILMKNHEKSVDFDEKSVDFAVHFACLFELFFDDSYIGIGVDHSTMHRGSLSVARGPWLDCKYY